MDGELNSFFRRVFACSAEVASVIQQRAIARGYPARAVILAQDDRSAATYLLIDGRAHALLYGLEGQVVLLHEYASGDIFGALDEGEARRQDAEVVAAEPSRVAQFLARDFLALIETYACVGLAVSRLLMRQLRTASARMAEQVTLSATGRVHAELLRLARLGDGRTISPAPVLAALAVRVHSTRETVSRTISALERRGMIRRDPGALVLLAPQRLEEMVI